jgi:hypothetical protein
MASRAPNIVIEWCQCRVVHPPLDSLLVNPGWSQSIWGLEGDYSQDPLSNVVLALSGGVRVGFFDVFGRSRAFIESEVGLSSSISNSSLNLGAAGDWNLHFTFALANILDGLTEHNIFSTLSDSGDLMRIYYDGTDVRLQHVNFGGPTVDSIAVPLNLFTSTTFSIYVDKGAGESSFFINGILIDTVTDLPTALEGLYFGGNVQGLIPGISGLYSGVAIEYDA